MFDVMADAIAEVPHGATKHLRPLRAPSEKFVNGHVVKGKAEAGFLGILTSMVFV